MMKDLFFGARGLAYRVNEFRSDYKTLVFVHGLSGSSSAWGAYEKKFEENYNILTFDLRGHGRSIKYAKYEDYTIQKIADDLNELMIYLGINKFVLISHSFGVLAALEYLSLHQDKVEAAVFLSPSHSVKRRMAAHVIYPLLSISKIFNFLPAKRRVGGRIDYSNYINTGDWNVRRTIADVRNTSFRVYLFCTKQSYNVDYESLLPKIKIPTLIVHGKKDTIFPIKEYHFMHENIVNSKLVLLEESDHIIVLNDFEEVSGAIEGFLREID